MQIVMSRYDKIRQNGTTHDNLTVAWILHSSWGIGGAKMLFNYKLRCSHCGLLGSSFTKRQFAERAIITHKEGYSTMFGENDHYLEIINLNKKGGTDEPKASPKT